MKVKADIEEKAEKNEEMKKVNNSEEKKLGDGENDDEDNIEAEIQEAVLNEKRMDKR